MSERHYAPDEPLEAWMAEHKVTELDVLRWVHAPSLYRYVTRALRGLFRRQAAERREAYKRVGP